MLAHLLQEADLVLGRGGASARDGPGSGSSGCRLHDETERTEQDPHADRDAHFREYMMHGGAILSRSWAASWRFCVLRRTISSHY